MNYRYWISENMIQNVHVCSDGMNLNFDILKHWVDH